MTLLLSRQKTFFLRHALTLLPQPYTSSDASRMLFGYFTVAGLDLLSILDDPVKVPPTERQGFIDWIYRSQLSTGGFRGFPGTDLGDKGNETNQCWDPANVAGTFFGLVTLLVLGDDLQRVKRRKCLEWLTKIQRQEDGSFGEIVGPKGEVEGGRDTRFCCCAAGIRYILRGLPGKGDQGLEDVKDIDIDKMVAFLRSCQGYDGGFGHGPLSETHSGLTYAAIGALSFAGKLPTNPSNKKPLPDVDGISLEACVKWILGRQTIFLEEYESDDEEEEEDEEPAKNVESVENGLQNLDLENQDDPTEPPALDYSGIDFQFAGFSGRPNKIADTCYCWWNTGALAMLHREHLVDVSGMRRYLLEKTQHIVGGFGKGVGATPDIMHAYLGLAALSIYGEPDLQPIDPTFCTSVRIRDQLNKVSWWKDDSKPELSKASDTQPNTQSYVAISGG